MLNALRHGVEGFGTTGWEGIGSAVSTGVVTMRSWIHVVIGGLREVREWRAGCKGRRAELRRSSDDVMLPKRIRVSSLYAGYIAVSAANVL